MNGIMNSLYPSVNSLEWRRSKVLELSSQGRSQPEIARILHTSQPTINRDLQYLWQEAKKNIMRYIDEKLPEEYEKTLCGLNSILREAWNISASKQHRKYGQGKGVKPRKGLLFNETRTSD